MQNLNKQFIADARRIQDAQIFDDVILSIHTSDKGVFANLVIFKNGLYHSFDCCNGVRSTSCCNKTRVKMSEFLEEVDSYNQHYAEIAEMYQLQHEYEYEPVF